MQGRPIIELDRSTFDPWKVGAVRHHLEGHPSLELPRLIALARRLGQAGGGIRYHDDRASPDTSFVNAPETNRPALAPVEALERIEEARVWLALHNVQLDPEYRALVDDLLDSVKPVVDARDPGMCHRAGWIFVTSPGAVTPYHMDHEHNFILQVRGRKTLHVWEPLDREVVTERALELFHARGSRELVLWSEAIQPKAHVFDLEPGMGGYMPSTAPHWVKNGPEVSVTVSATYYSDSTRRTELLHIVNDRLRGLGLSPRPVGASAQGDAVKLGAARVLHFAKNTGRRLVGRKTPPPVGTYSPG
jgi:hypothetical protein